MHNILPCSRDGIYKEKPVGVQSIYQNQADGKGDLSQAGGR